MTTHTAKQTSIPTLKSFTKSLTPPFLWNALAQLRNAYKRSQTPKWKHGVEQSSEFYDWSFERSKSSRQHYTESYYYPLWTIVADRVKRARVKSVLDIGCGPGQFASFLFDKGITSYLGLDFSKARIEQARRVCPGYAFEVADVFESTALNDGDFDCVLIMEFLEHIEKDLEVLQRIKPGTRVIATVPNFPATGHVRLFNDVESVRERYGSFIEQMEVIEHLPDTKGKRFFLIEGIASSASLNQPASVQT